MPNTIVTIKLTVPQTNTALEELKEARDRHTAAGRYAARRGNSREARAARQRAVEIDSIIKVIES